MGRTEPTIVKPPAAFRRDARAKRARATLNKVIPAMLSAHPRARQGVERSELVVDPPTLPPLSSDGKKRDDAAGGSADVKTAGGRRRRKKLAMEEDNRGGDETLSHEEKGAGRSAANGPPRITLCVGDALTAAQGLLSHSTSQQNQNQKQQYQHQRKGGVSAEASGRKYKKVGILNMASPLAPGGGFLNGATGPEASLCLRTTLLPALRDEFYRLPELGVVYTPDVLVFRPLGDGSERKSSGSIEDDEDDILLPKNDRWFVDVASAAMLRLPETTSDEDEEDEEGWRTAYASASDRALAERKMRAVLRVFATRGCEAVVLGAWGCGPHEGNPIAEIAAAWRRVLGVEHGEDHHDRRWSESKDKKGVVDKVRSGGGGGKNKKRNKEQQEREPWGAYFSDVIFAIKDRGTATSFARVFGEEYIAASSPALISSPSSTIDDDEEEEPRVSELREKIAELEVQVAQVRSPHLRVGLESVLAGLRRQFPSLGENDDDNDNDNDVDDDHDGVSSSGQDPECLSETDEN
ncbi:hypothetical protein FHL15_005573 [Xylaria flabelliformis]|uniref:Microbial-type PARG catalytic domain-containing protein n=1 Tax=Xylaria flabelliformis TaxID=2512241 RepID=A0A553I086_9PEZI|nr:hypothetical protein FHL15_005573 [Xylaria flabelliformis]